MFSARIEAQLALEKEEAEANAIDAANPKAPGLERNISNPSDILNNLKRRFLDVPPEIVQQVLERQLGHGGNAARVLRDMASTVTELGKSVSEPLPLARLVSPTKGLASSDAFPNVLGPFELVATSFQHSDFIIASSSARHSGKTTWSMKSSQALKGAAKKAVQRVSGAAQIKGNLSAEHEITLPDADKCAAGIPEDAVSFAWSYPIERALAITGEFASNPHVTFLVVGGYVYFNKNKQITKVTALVPSVSGGLRLGCPQPWPPELTRKVGLGNFRPVTIAEMRDGGARKFSWVRPGEVDGMKHGGFAYLFEPSHETGPKGDLCFPVLGGNEEGTQLSAEDIPITEPSHSLPETKEHKGKPLAPWDMQARLSITPAIEITPETDCEEAFVLVSVQPPDGAACQKTSICIVLDVSGSMRKEATVQGAGETESNGLSLLDVAKHGVRTIIQSLGAEDHLSIVKFNNRSEVVLPPTEMNDEGRALAEKRLDQLTAKGGTNIWEGLDAGLTALKETEEDGIFGHIMLLTDGVSSNADTVLNNLRLYRDSNRLPCTINTFGFGYKLDSPMLVDIAWEGAGSYCFIPDAGFVGTVFIHTLSNLLVTMARDVYIDLQAGPGTEILSSKIPAYEVAVQEDGVARVSLGSIRYGQSKDIIVPMRIQRPTGTILKACGEYVINQISDEQELGSSGKIQENGIEAVEIMVGCLGPSADQASCIDHNRFRLLFVDQITLCMDEASAKESRQPDTEKALTMMKSFAAKMEQSLTSDDTKALYEDVTGQAMEALSKPEWYSKWGAHYLPSLQSAHLLQQCNNFKDPGVQLYGGRLFETVRDDADDTFNKLPAPKPTLTPDAPAARAPAPDAPAARAPVVRAPIDMSAYNNCYGG